LFIFIIAWERKKEQQINSKVFIRRECLLVALEVLLQIRASSQELAVLKYHRKSAIVVGEPARKFQNPRMQEIRKRYFFVCFFGDMCILFFSK
jgi:hypothetical protein